MPKPLSNDLRKRIIDSKLRGDTEDKIAFEKEVNKSTVTKLWSKYRSTGSYSPCSNRRGRKPMLSGCQLEQIRQKIIYYPSGIDRRVFSSCVCFRSEQNGKIQVRI